MTARLFVDIEGPIRAWARAAVALAGQRVYVGSPNTRPSGPWLAMQLVSSVPIAGGGQPVTRALIQFDAYASTRREAANLAAALVTAAESMPDGTVLDSTATGHAAVVTRHQFLPTDTERLSRYSVDIDFAISATGA